MPRIPLPRKRKRRAKRRSAARNRRTKAETESARPNGRPRFSREEEFPRKSSDFCRFGAYCFAFFEKARENDGTMILAPLKDSARYEALNPHFKKLFDYVKTHDLTTVPAGKIVVDGDDAFINVVDHPGKTLETAKLESHKKYLDVHVPLSAPETLGWTPRGEIPETPYDEDGDCQVYPGKAKVYTTIQPGEFVVYWPEDIHAPAISDRPFRKLIMKARCD